MLALYHEPMPATSGIYKITCTVNGRFYIGSAIDLQERRKNHFGTLQRNIHKNPKLQRAWNKYGPDAFTYEIVELVLMPFLLEREQYWFDKLKPFDKRGYNIAPKAGSNFGKKHSPETIAKIRASNCGRSKPYPGHPFTAEARAKMSAAHKGKPSTRIGYTASAETRAKLSEAAKRQSHDPEIKAAEMKTLIAISPDGTEYIVRGIKRFCREHNLIHTGLMNVAKGKQRVHKGWTARFPDEGTA